MAKDKKTETTTAKEVVKETNALFKIGCETLRINENLSAVHITSDGTAFANKGDALNHGKTLTDTDIITVEKEGVKDE